MLRENVTFVAACVLLAVRLLLDDCSDLIHRLRGGCWSIDYDSEEVARYFAWTCDGPLTAVGGASAFDGAWNTGLFKSRHKAEAFRDHLQRSVSHIWPILPAKLVRVSPSDPRINQSQWR